MTKEQQAPCKVRITQCSKRTWWYAHNIGDEFETDAPDHLDFVVWEDIIKARIELRCIDPQDCIVIERNGQKV